MLKLRCKYQNIQHSDNSENFLTQDEIYMLRCLELAALGAGSAAPNPMVGSVIVHNASVIGEGYHQKCGQAHAEVNAVNSVSDHELLKDSTIYVSLEPCAHYGKTPPCADLIVSKGFKRAVIACHDPFAKVNGAGISRLRDAGIDVTVGLLEKEALALNRRFITFHEKKRPYVILKWAETRNGFVDIVRKNSVEPALKVTCEASNILVHKWRAEEDSIMIGKRTALLDRPSLTTRKYAGKNPIRIVLDSGNEVPEIDALFDDAARTIHITENTISDPKSTDELLTFLYLQEIQSVIVEGGPTVHRSFYESGNWDEIRRFVAPLQLEAGIPALELSETPEEKHTIGCDQLLIYRNR